jgi:CDP-diglyceride synthetase
VWFVFEDLKLRSLSALILLSVLFLFAFIAPFLITPALYALNILFLRELFKLFSFKKEQLFLNLFLITVCIFPLYFAQTNLSITFVFNLCLFFLILYLSKSKGLSFFIIYVNLSISFLLSLLVSPTEVGGISFFVILVLSVAFADIGGYFGGRIFGGPKVLEKISPSKTWAGIFVGWTMVITFYYALKSYNLFGSDFFVFVFFGIALSSQVGDFVESYVKRNLGVKDTGNIIPGHGGLLDRFDGLICTSFFVKIIDVYLKV